VAGVSRGMGDANDLLILSSFRVRYSMLSEKGSPPPDLASQVATLRGRFQFKGSDPFSDSLSDCDAGHRTTFYSVVRSTALLTAKGDKNPQADGIIRLKSISQDYPTSVPGRPCVDNRGPMP
jgi:hypothetical protein